MVGADAPYTATWVQKFPECEMREKASETLMSRWAREDPKAAATWLAGLGQGQTYQAAVVKYVESAATLEPELAWELARTIQDGKKQNDAMERAARQWLRADDKTARAMILASGLPAEVIAKLLKPND
jgi:hypothetical protein